MHKVVVGSVLLGFIAVGNLLAQGQAVLITLDENGNGTLQFGTDPAFLTTGTMLADPGPGGLSSALTYDLLGPPSLVAGDLILFEPGTGNDVNSDIVRFNPANSNTAYPASVVFYSDILDGVDALADTGFPTTLYANLARGVEVGPEGNNGFTYTPTSNQPGYVGGFAVTYNIVSDSVPEPASVSLILAGAAVLLTCRRRWATRAGH